MLSDLPFWFQLFAVGSTVSEIIEMESCCN